jgi:hypothetical protein
MDGVTDADRDRHFTATDPYANSHADGHNGDRYSHSPSSN